MRVPFDEILSECLRRLERGEDLEAVLGDYADQADQLRPHLEVWATLSRTERAAASPEGFAAGRSRLASALAGAGRERPAPTTLVAKGGLTMRYALAVVAGAAFALGVTFLAGGLDFGDGGTSTAQAEIPHECLEDLDLNGDGSLTVEDVLLFKDAIENQDGAFDFNGDTVVDIHDGVLLIQGVVDCFQNLQPPSP